MNSLQPQSNSLGGDIPSFGLMATSRSGRWEVAIDESTAGPDRWFVQIEGPVVYLYCEIASIAFLEEFLTFIESPGQLSVGRQAQLIIRKSKGSQVLLLRDDEFADRFFLCVETSSNTVSRVTIGGDDLGAIAIATHEVVNELNRDAS